ncbi:MAG: addiction module toxin, RelE/StbE family [Mucilaginibacter sp.]|nr:addiction module toxin, RelE/StbE family [Mucilaginibacter sp.]
MASGYRMKKQIARWKNGCESNMVSSRTTRAFEILEYWVNRNKSKIYSKRLYQLFRKGMKKVAEMPEAGIPTENPDIIIKIIRDYLFTITSALLKH